MSYAAVVRPSFPDFTEDGIMIRRRLIPVDIPGVRADVAVLDLVGLAGIHVVRRQGRFRHVS